MRGAKKNANPVVIGVDTKYGAAIDTFNGHPIMVGVSARDVKEQADPDTQCIGTRYAELMSPTPIASRGSIRTRYNRLQLQLTTSAMQPPMMEIVSPGCKV